MTDAAPGPVADNRLDWSHARDPEALLACGFGSGFLRPAPGTWGTVAALGIWWFLIAPLEPPLQLLIVLATALVGSVISGRVCRRYGVKDPGAIVIDEFAGLWLTLLGFNQDWWVFVVVGFLLFRLFDIWKPGPVGWADRQLSGGFGVMADDLVAGCLAALVLQVAFFGFILTDAGLLP
ncbi:MAG: phosphatidylglycerophosphatase A [Pseudomonadota bacterium]